ncbi:zinc ABC transporter substrate-binding protein [Streptomyces sp. WMMC500]|uniref:metal ABC transporter solute-binding protein, Zn/Mn family n=1 Tax=Streptomyces sp. WMMC500 TaxID=3015154 RepID=UPI00248AE76C|nr:zinc ABC transporter substrate-binding protein [Streptomyces sp. WMMC500]WBB59452.1 zinc ABC transporter substrate-binding protein [Streptomyces sp. WMMC500]
MSVMRIRRRSISGLTPAAAAALSAAAVVALSACGTGDAGTTTDDGRLRVTASFYPMQFLAEEIGGRNAEVSTLTKPGTEPHDLELSPRQTGDLADAGLIIYLKDMQPAVDEAIEQSGAEHVVEASEFTTLEKHGSEEDGHGHEEDGHAEDEHAEEGHAEDEHAEDGHAAEEEADGGHEGHDHGDEDGPDPHIWLDPVRYAEVAEGVGEAMAKADPDHAGAYEKNAAELADRLRKLDGQFAAGLENRRTDTFITTHAAFGYVADRYGLVQESIKGLSPESEPSAARMQELQDVAEADGVTTVFFETLVSDKTARTLAGDLDLKTDVLDPIEGVTDKSKGDDYFEIMEANLAALQRALGAT